MGKVLGDSRAFIQRSPQDPELTAHNMRLALRLNLAAGRVRSYASFREDAWVVKIEWFWWFLLGFFS